MSVFEDISHCERVIKRAIQKHGKLFLYGTKDGNIIIFRKNRHSIAILNDLDLEKALNPVNDRNYITITGHLQEIVNRGCINYKFNRNREIEIDINSFKDMWKLYMAKKVELEWIND